MNARTKNSVVVRPNPRCAESLLHECKRLIRMMRCFRNELETDCQVGDQESMCVHAFCFQGVFLDFEHTHRAWKVRRRAERVAPELTLGQLRVLRIIVGERAIDLVRDWMAVAELQKLGAIVLKNDGGLLRIDGVTELGRQILAVVAGRKVRA